MVGISDWLMAQAVRPRCRSRFGILQDLSKWGLNPTFPQLNREHGVVAERIPELLRFDIVHQPPHSLGETG